MKISFCIPLYNKAFAIENVVKSIVDVCEKYEVDYEINISNSASTDISPTELDKKLFKYKNVNIYHLPGRISLRDNWFLALNLGKGDIINLHLADDPLLDFDIKKLISIFGQGDIDYVVGKTKLSIEVPKDDEKLNYEYIRTITTYFNNFNDFRSKIRKDLTIEEKVKIFEKYNIYKLSNFFGEINGWFFRKSSLDIINSYIDYQLPSFLTYPDFEIGLKMFLFKNGVFLDEYVSLFSVNTNSLTYKNLGDDKRKYFKKMIARTFLYQFIHDISYADIIKKLSESTKLDIAYILIRQIKEWFDILSTGNIDFIIDNIKDNVLNPTPKYIEHIEDNQKPFPSDKFKVGWISRFEPEKGWRDLLEALKDTDIEVDFIGDGSDLENAKNLKQEKNLKNINFLGWIENGFDYIKENVDVLVFSSRDENAPSYLSDIIKGLSLGVPVIAYHTTKSQKILGEKGLIYKTPTELKDIILKLKTDQKFYECMSQHSVERAKEFSIERVKEKWNSVFKELEVDL